jgi:G3E family GTPase
MIPVVIVSGFLGSGKTTFLRNLLPVCGKYAIKPALIINEVGKADVDGELLDDLVTDSVRLLGGCVCCTLQSRLSQTLDDVVSNYDTNMIIIECSGLSNPIDVISAVSMPALTGKVATAQVITLVDSKRAVKVLKVAELAKEQVRAGNVIVLNKTDEIEEAQWNEVYGLVKEISPDARILRAEYGDIGAEEFGKIVSDKSFYKECTCQCGEDHDHDHHHHHQHHHELPDSFFTVAVDLPDMTTEQIQQMMEKLPLDAIRVKGFAFNGKEWFLLHRVYDSVDVMPYKKEPSCGAVLICIGQRLNGDVIRDIVDQAVNL